jgi:glycosyltransferase involved in cell wall biosynthesis
MNKIRSMDETISPDPIITIITATYNAEKLLPRTIESIKNLQYKNYQWIVIDGASKDNTINIIKNNLDVISNWISEPDQGIYDAWNKGLSLSRGEWIAFIGAGDSYYINALSCYADAIKKASPKVNFISSRVEFINIDGDVKRTWGQPLEKEQFKKFMSIAHVGALHHKSLFNQKRKFDIKYRSAADYDFFLSSIDFIEAAFTNKITAQMIIGGSSDSFFSLWEKYKIQRKYHNSIYAKYLFLTSCLKKVFRRLIKRY